jgi:CPA1 family monovalent cation:H+ antiporter
MAVFELVVGLLFVGGLLALLANRAGLPYPALLALVGAALALVPGTPTVTLDPELALALFVAPTLLDAAYDASPRDLRSNLVPVVSLAVLMVIVTVAAVAWTMRLVVPDVGWATAITLGAIVAPPDASAASAVLHRLRPPHRLLVILEGESLFNDATSLLIYRAAVGAAVTGAFTTWSVVPLLFVTCVGGVVAGYVLARAYLVASSKIDDIPINVMFGFIATFAVWMLAERLGLSAIITVVTFAMTLARRLGGRMYARHRIASYAVWEVAVLVLNVLAFALIGLQLRGIVARVSSGEWGTYALAAVAVCGAVILVRMGWVMLHTSIDRLREPAARRPSYGAALVSSWCGMRGIVTLAAALALPDAFPHRDVIVFCAFCVVFVTLVGQGLTLRPLMQWLQLRDDGVVEREAELARVETVKAGLAALDGHELPAADRLRSHYQARLRAVTGDSANGATDVVLARLRRKAVDAEREALADLRARRVIGDDALHVLEEEIDVHELAGETPGASSHRSGPDANETRTPRSRGRQGAVDAPRDGARMREGRARAGEAVIDLDPAIGSPDGARRATVARTTHEQEETTMSYIDGYVVAVPAANKERYRKEAAEAAALFKRHGALRQVETWGDDVPRGKLTDFWGAVKAADGESIVFSWVVWPSKEVRDAAYEKMEAEGDMKPPDPSLFDGKRMIYGGFEVLLDTDGELGAAEGR